MDDEIFSQVTACLSAKVLDRIHGDKKIFLAENVCPLGVLVSDNLENAEVFVTGNLKQIVACWSILNCKLIEENQDVLKNVLNPEFCWLCKSFPTRTEVIKPRSVSSELQSNKENKSKNSANVKVYVSKRGKAVESEEDETPVYLPRKKSKYGRSIKIPQHLKSDIVDLNFLNKESEDEKEEKEGSQNDLDFIVKSDRLNYLKKDYKVKETRSRNIKILAPKGDKRSLRRYYEEKMPFKFFCTKCSFKTKRQCHFDSHMEYHTSHPDIELFRCGICDFTTVRGSVLARHKLTHSATILKCSESGDCSFVTDNPKSLKDHMRKKHNIIEKEESGEKPNAEESFFDQPVKCDLCIFTTTSRIKLDEHSKTHSEVLQTSISGQHVFSCKLCPYQGKRKVNLMRHLDSVHTGRRPHLCDLCGMAFKRSDALQAHKETHLDRSKRKLPFQCLKCGKAFRAKFLLKEHQAVHSTLRLHQCHICGQLFKTPIVQKRHMQLVHNSSQKHICQVCNRGFSTKYVLKRHKRVHEDTNAVIGVENNLTDEAQNGENVGKLAGVNAESKLFLAKYVNRKLGVLGPEQKVASENESAIESIMISAENLQGFDQGLEQTSEGIHVGVATVYVDETEAGLGVEGAEVVRINDLKRTQPLFMPATSTVVFVTSAGHAAGSDIVQNLNTFIGVDVGGDHIQSIEGKAINELYIETEVREEEIQSSVAGSSASSLLGTAGTEQVFETRAVPQEMDSSQVLSDEGQTTLNLELLDGQDVFEQGQIIGDGEFLELIASDGRTYHLKIEGLGIENILSLPSNSSSQTD
ncbi:zinc finger protein 43-like [Dreissena polymorpha]|uniref:C2H2-type domain-containing protein n=1 Tax=Dreissena polymorpha TaxID=45954 RepID=A0A9D4CBJ2_DREPO|nr:zinc finger protein 43-like [Dreissena polymorpha]KAH3720449.1 hypothetical protein DPMN_063348 [Dreissena polymorpha]